MDKKKIIIAIIVVVLVIGIGVSYYLTAQPTTKPQAQGTTPVQTGDTGAMPNQNAMQNTRTNGITPTGTANTPEMLAETFYSWYMNYPKDVVATGAYKTSPYLTQDFITTINGFAARYNPQYDPIFCTRNKTKNFQVSHAMSVGDPTKVKVQILNKNADNPQPIYDIIIVQQNGMLKIDDIQCD